MQYEMLEKFFTGKGYCYDIKGKRENSYSGSADTGEVLCGEVWTICRAGERSGAQESVPDYSEGRAEAL